MIIVIPNPNPPGTLNSTFHQENPRSTEEREISAQGQLDNHDVTMDYEEEDDETPPSRLAERVSGESVLSPDTLDQARGEFKMTAGMLGGDPSCWQKKISFVEQSSIILIIK